MTVDRGQSSFAVDGMFCGGCAATVERALTRVPGVQSASVSFVSDAALVRHDDNVSPDMLAAAIGRLGYSARSLSDDTEGANASAHNTFQRRLQIRLAVAICFGMWTMLASLAGYLGQIPTTELARLIALGSGGLAAPVIFFSGIGFYRLGWRSLRAGVPGMETLIAFAVIAAVGASVGNLLRGNTQVYFDAAVMLITFQLVARLTDFSVRRSAGDAVRRLLQLAPERARKVTINGLRIVHPRLLKSGDIVEAQPGERISVDGVIIGGVSQLDSSLLTGEAMPRRAAPGDCVRAGELLMDGVLRIRVEAAGGSRQIDMLATQVRQLIISKGTLARLADQVARWLLPTILVAAICALILAVLTGHGWEAGMSRALAVVIVTCPCALSLAVPLVLGSAASAGARRGVILRDPGALERAAALDTVMFDKTGTLTRGQPEVVAVHGAPGCTRSQVLAVAARAEAASSHPLALAICRATEVPFAVAAPSEVREYPGQGVQAVTPDAGTIRVGSIAWFGRQGLPCLNIAATPAATRVAVAVDDAVIGVIELADPLRSDAADVVADLCRDGYRVILASGDGKSAVAAVAAQLELEAYSELLPDDKLALVKQWQRDGHRVAFVGDGLNDGPVLAASDLGIAVGSANDLARSAAAVGLLRDGVAPVALALTLAPRAGRVLRQNLYWALTYNGLLLPAAVAGFVHPLFAAVAMAASSMSVSFNSLRAGWLPRTS